RPGAPRRRRRPQRDRRGAGDRRVPDHREAVADGVPRQVHTLNGTSPSGCRTARAAAPVGQNCGVAFGGGHRRWVGTDGTPVVWRPAPAGSAAATRAAPTAAAPAAETAGQEDARTPVMVAEDGVPTPPAGIPAVAADRPHHRPRWWSDALHDPERHRPLPRWESPEQSAPPPADPAPAADPPPAEPPPQRAPR